MKSGIDIKKMMEETKKNRCRLCKRLVLNNPYALLTHQWGIKGKVCGGCASKALKELGNCSKQELEEYIDSKIVAKELME